MTTTNTKKNPILGNVLMVVHMIVLFQFGFIFILCSIYFYDINNNNNENGSVVSIAYEKIQQEYLPPPHDVTALRQNPPTFVWQEDGLCSSSSKNRGLLRQENDLQLADPNILHRRRDTLLCIVYTLDSSRTTRIPAIRETWGPKCDGFLFASNRTDPTINAVHIPHRGKEAYKNMFQKVKSIWYYVYMQYYEQYDWFHIGGDDMWILVENLMHYLNSPEIQNAQNGNGTLSTMYQRPLYLGSTFALYGKLRFQYNSGGPGYTLNKAALKLLVTRGLPKYFPNLVTNAEDVAIAFILKYLGVRPYPTVDAQRRQRYHHFPPGFYSDKNHHHLPKWYLVNTSPFHYAQGNNSFSNTSIAFHYVQPNEMRRLHAIVYGLCNPKERHGITT